MPAGDARSVARGYSGGGPAAAYPVNVLLIRFGVKEGMHDPREMARAA